MQTIRRIGIGFLVGLFFAAGYAARLSSAANEPVLDSTVQRAPVSAPGTPVASVGLEGGANIDLRPLETLLVILKSLREHYVEQISAADEGRMTYDSLRVMLADLDDPNTRFVTPDQRKLIADSTKGTFHGVGVILGIKQVKSGKLTEEHLVVVTPLESGPASAAGVKPGDDIAAIDGKPVLPFDPYQKANEIFKEEWNKKEKSEVKKHLEAEKKRIESGIPMLEAESLLISEDKKPVELTIARKGSAKQIKIKITPGQFTINPVTSSVLDDGRLGYIKVSCFCAGTAEKFTETIVDLKSKGVKGLILDLRNAAGGDADTAVAIAKPLLAGRSLAVELKSRGRKVSLNVPNGSADETWHEPVIALVNGGTVRMAEVLAASLKENRRARLVGEKTYGDFTDSALIDQQDGSAVIMTTGLFTTSQGKDYSKIGVPVDVPVASTQSGDPQLKEAIRLLSEAGGKG